ncbi:MAG: hypothetical protein AAF937_12575 [Planctomycetota bacterium]
MQSTRASRLDAQSKPGGRVALVDGEQHFNRRGLELAEAFSFLVGCGQQIPELMTDGSARERLLIG